MHSIRRCGVRFPYVVMYVALVVYTIKFTWEYLKRAITMAFLTLMAPVVAITYPIDKLGDGKAQAFNMWLKEYIFNLLLQPFHLIIYTVFVESAINIAINNPIYAIFFLAFITPAEKLLRKFFGFDKSSTAGGSSFAGGFGGAAAFNMLKGAISKGAQGIQHAKGGQNSTIRQKDNKMIKDPNAPKGDLASFKNGSQNGNNPEIDNPKGNSESLNKPSKNNALGQYEAEGYGKNANGEYFNPYTDEYDPNYDPHNDPLYNVPQKDEALAGYTADGYGKNANGEYYNPYTDEYDSNYDPHNDSLYNTPQDNEMSASMANEDTGRIATGQFNERPEGLQNAQALATANNTSTQQRFTSQQNVRKLANDRNKEKRNIPPALKGVGKVAIRGAIGTAKVAGKLAGAAVLGTIGLGMGIASDNLEDVFSYGAAGAALGYSALPAIGKNTIEGVKSIGNTVRSDYEIGAYGETEAAKRQFKRDTVHNKELRAEEKERMTRENGVAPTKSELNERMGQVADYQLAGITDSSEMHKAMQIEKEINKQMEDSGIAEEERAKMARQQAIDIAKYAKEIPRNELMDSKKVENYKKNIVEKITKGEGGLAPKQASQTADNILNNVKRIKGV